MFLRPSCFCGVPLLFSIAVILCIIADSEREWKNSAAERAQQSSAVVLLGLSDMALVTEARYTRHPAVSDRVAPFMDHPGDIEHFPSGSFFAPHGQQ